MHQTRITVHWYELHRLCAGIQIYVVCIHLYTSVSMQTWRFLSPEQHHMQGLSD